MELNQIPPSILQLIADEAEGLVACGPTAAEDVPIDDIKAAARQRQSTEPITTVSELFRQHSNGRLLFTVEHMGRYARKLETTFGPKAGNAVVCGASFNSASRLLEQNKASIPTSGRRLRLISWAVETDKGSKILSLCYFITAAAYPANLATEGVVVSIAFDNEMDDQHRSDIIFDTLKANKDGVVEDGIRSRFICVAEGAVVVPLCYTPTGSDEEVLNMSVALIGLRSACAKLGIDFRTVDLTLGHIAYADCVALVSDDHDIAPVKQIAVSTKDKAKINPAFLPAFVEADGWLVLNKDRNATGLIDSLNSYICQKGYQWGDDLNNACSQQ